MILVNPEQANPNAIEITMFRRFDIELGRIYHNGTGQTFGSFLIEVEPRQEQNIRVDARPFYRDSFGDRDSIRLLMTDIDLGIRPCTYFSIRAFDFSPGTTFQGVPSDPISEPATLLLLGTGLAGVGAVVRKRRKAHRDDA
jgi:hypothetical protein